MTGLVLVGTRPEPLVPVDFATAEEAFNRAEAGQAEAQEETASQPEPANLDERLRECEQGIDEAWTGVNRLSMQMGWDGNFIKRHEGWARLGYEDEKDFRAKKHIARSTWYKMVGLAERFPDLTRAQFCSMLIENAVKLAEAPREVRHDLKLVAAAAASSEREFEGELVLEQSAREQKPVGEVYVTMKWRIKQAQREVIQRGLEDWQREHGIDDEGYALELLIAEYRERPTLVGFMTESISRLSRELTRAQTAEDLEELRKGMAQHILDMAEILKICCGEERAA
jgi:hypothetical protein